MTRALLSSLEPLPSMKELRAASACGLSLIEWRDRGRPMPAQSTSKKGTRAKGGYRSALEASYADHLERQRLCGLILAWQYEPRRFTVGVRRTYRPDFRVVSLSPGGGAILSAGRWSSHFVRPVIRYDEVKGSKHAKNARDSITRLHTVAMLYPHLRFSLVTRRGGDWTITPIEGKA